MRLGSTTCTAMSGSGVRMPGVTTMWERLLMACLLYTSDAADERSSVDLGGRRIIKKKKIIETVGRCTDTQNDS